MFTMRPQRGVEHVGQDGLGAVEGAVEIHLHHPVELLVGDLQELAETGDAGVVDEHEDRSEFGAHPLHRLVDLLTARHVDTGRGGFAARLANLAHHLVGGVGIEVEHGDRATITRQPMRDRTTHARTGARHHRNATIGHATPSTPTNVVRCISRQRVLAVGQRSVQHAGVVPHRQVALAPPMADDELRLRGPCEETLEQRAALSVLHADDIARGRAEQQRCSAVLTGPHERVRLRRPALPACAFGGGRVGVCE